MKNAYVILSTDANPTVLGVLDSRKQANRYIDYLYLKRGVCATYVKSRMIDYNVITVNNVYIKATYNVDDNRRDDILNVLMSIKTEIVDQKKYSLLEDMPDYQIWNDKEYDRYFIFKYNVSNIRKQDILPSSIVIAREKLLDKYTNDESFTL